MLALAYLHMLINKLIVVITEMQHSYAPRPHASLTLKNNAYVLKNILNSHDELAA
jgi:hypothetical protein